MSAVALPALRSVNPTSGEVVADYPQHEDASIDRAVRRSDSCFAQWRRTRFDRRGELLSAVALELERRRDSLTEGVCAPKFIHEKTVVVA